MTAHATVIITVEIPVQEWSDEYDLPTGEVAQDAGRYLADVIAGCYAAGQGLVRIHDVEGSQ